MRWWRFWSTENKQLKTIESLLRTAIKHQEGMMAILGDLQVVVNDIAADAVAMEDEIRIAVEHIVKSVDVEGNPALKHALESLQASHGKLAASFNTLKAKVDEVMASGGPASSEDEGDDL